MSNLRTVCVVPGDDAAPEVVIPTIQILQKMQLPLAFTPAVTGDPAVAQYGDEFPASAKRAIDESDCSLMGSTRSIRGVHGYLRWGKQCYANVRPTRYFDGLRSPFSRPKGIDFVIVRENLEGLYPAGWEGQISQLSPLRLFNEKLGLELDTTQQGMFAVKITSDRGTRRVCRKACALARERKLQGHPGKVTVASIMLLASSPSPVRDLKANGPAGGPVRVTWAASPEKNVTGYVVAWGPADAPLRHTMRVVKPAATIPGATPGMVVSVKAVNVRGLEGWDWARTPIK